MPEYIAPDPMGAEQDWRQTLARTAVLEQQAQQAPIQTQQMGLQLRGQQMQIQAAQRAQAEDAAWRQRMQTLTGITDNAKFLEQVGRAAFESGRDSEGQKALQLLSVMTNRASLEEQRAATAEQRQAAARLNQIKQVANIYSGVTDAFTWNAAHDLYKEISGEESPLKKYPYDAKFVKLATESLRKQYGDLESRVMQSREAANNARATAANAAAGLSSARVAAVQERSERTAVADNKAGGKITAPTVQETKLAKQVVKDAFPEMPAADLEAVARELASRAKPTQLRGGAGDLATLYRRTLAESPELVKQVGKKVLGVPVPGTVPAKGQTALPMPSDPSKLRPGVAYVYNGKNFRYLGGPMNAQTSWEEIK